MTLITDSLFRTNNTEILEVADAYDITDTRPINKIYESAKGGVKNLIGKLGSAQDIGNALGKLVALKQQGVTGKELLSSSLGMFGSSIGGVLKAAGGSVMDKAAGFIDLDPSIVDKIKIGGEYVVSAIEYGDVRSLGDVQFLSGLMGDMVGNEGLMKYVNIGIESAIWGAALTGASSMNLFDYYDAIRDNVDEDVYHQAVVFSLPTVATGGSIKGIDAMISAIGAQNIIVNYPEFVQTFISNYQIPNPATGTYEQMAVELVNKLSQIEPNWYRYNRNGEQIFDMKYLVTPSADAVRVLETHPELGTVVQIAKFFPEAAVIEAMRAEFPLMVM